MRYSAWLRSEQASLRWTQYRLGKALGNVPASRVSAWLSGKRSITPETAFSHGQRLAENGARSASGPLALFACGYLEQYLRLLQQLGSMVFDDGPVLAVTLYCATPHMLSWLDAIGVDEVFTRELDKYEFGLPAALLRSFAMPFETPAKPRNPITELREQSSSPSVRKIYEEAWQNVLRDEGYRDESLGYEIAGTPYEYVDEDDTLYIDRVNDWARECPLRSEETARFVKWALSRPRGNKFIPDDVLAWYRSKPRVPRRANEWFQKIPNPGNWTLDDADLELLERFALREPAVGEIDFVIEFVAKTQTPYAYALAPRAWRLLVDWALLTEPTVYQRLRRFIPPRYLTIA